MTHCIDRSARHCLRRGVFTDVDDPVRALCRPDPDDASGGSLFIFAMTRGYLRIIFLGMMFTFLYNFFASTLRALGDSSSPLYFLIISTVLNIFGDLFFVVVLKAGSNGCAISTVLSEALCSLFCVIYIQKKVPLLRLGKKWLVFDSELLKRTIAYGWASAMQQATVQLGKIRDTGNRQYGWGFLLRPHLQS